MPTSTLEVRFTSSPTGLDSEDNDGRLILDGIQESMSLEDVIRRTVEEETRLLKSRATARERVTFRGFLTDEEIEDLAVSGKVGLDSQRASRIERLDPERETKRALEAFRSGRFLVFAGKRQIEDLQERLSFPEQASMTFLRLTPLAGG